MQGFVDRRQDRITGVLTGLDRVLFRGNLQSMSCLYRLDRFLLRRRIPQKDFGSVVPTISGRVKTSATAFADENDRPSLHIHSPSAGKKAFVQRIIQHGNVTEGLVCVRGCVEVYYSFSADDRSSGSRRSPDHPERATIPCSAPDRSRRGEVVFGSDQRFASCPRLPQSRHPPCSRSERGT